MTLQLDPGTLRNLGSLELLDLGDNNLWGLPPRALCHAPALTTLNLTANNIVEVAEVGLREGGEGGTEGGCQMPRLTSLDLSFNRISSFLPGDLALAPALQSLNLRGNRLAVISDQALTGLWSLAHLDLALNQLVALPPTLLHQSRNLQKLFLENNSLSLLSPDVFAGLDNLLLLNVSRNQLTSPLLTDAMFANLHKLVALDLSHNQLTSVSSGVLKALQSLQILNLQGNLISEVSNKVTLK